MFTIEKITFGHSFTQQQLTQVCDFLHVHLEQYGDKPEDIRKSMGYALQEYASPGGFVLVGTEAERLVGAVVVNQTGMAGYIPENILVYIAIHADCRGKGYGRLLMERAITEAKGAVALHVEPDNPARRLYEKLGFTSKYLEMRLSR